MEENSINRLLLTFDQLLRKANREHINPEIEELTVDGMKPIASMVARSRARYLKYLYELSSKYDSKPDELPSTEELSELETCRRCFVDLADGAKSLEISIQRGYLDIKL